MGFTSARLDFDYMNDIRQKLPVVAENGGSVAVGVGVPGTEMPRRLVLVAPAARAHDTPLFAERSLFRD